MAGDRAAAALRAPEILQVSARLAAFAAGCLGTATPAKTGSRLGLMGSASEEEFVQVLHHMEVLSKQRAAKMAGLSAAAESDLTSGKRPCCSVFFEQALCEACGVSPSELGAAGIFALLPTDNSGRADLMRVFGMTSGKVSTRGGLLRRLGGSNFVHDTCSPSDDKSTETSGGCADGDASPFVEDFPADYVELASDLPSLPASAFGAARQHLLQEVDEADWAADTAAVNKLRSVLVHEASSEASVQLLLALAQRCRSRRPALSKTSLRAVMEFADARGATGVGSSWPEAAEVVVACCLAAIRVTKVAARLAEATLAAVLRRHAADTSPAAAAQMLTACAIAEVSAKVPQPAGVSAALRAQAPLMGGLAIARSPAMTGAVEAAAAVTAISSLCQDILENRRLAPAFSDARSVLRGLPRLQEVTGDGQNCDGERQDQPPVSRLTGKRAE
ncbi:unnamed protein product [Polarella glacialis]|uniref:Uncharacterized protein n=1 Tax=Polarella glacialis TaxID=89957 RepID=A0A813IIR6_POLGL|nr:unnamed protein product [Polarella glacialis]